MPYFAPASQVTRTSLPRLPGDSAWAGSATPSPLSGQAHAALRDTARALGYKLVWCIEKTNPTKLNKAIHTMVKWYANAHLCIVHIAASSSLSLSDFEHEQWCTRGWTLQALLAPRRIRFDDKGCRAFTTLANDKDDLMLLSWAATRKTTQGEDAAYYLYGLFDVHPTITYGRGEKTFPWLVEAIVDHGRCAWEPVYYCPRTGRLCMERAGV
ncbi:hypothetical protein OG21DRAFT_934138 [Imleria badia]|nr:hypothetical protein OG21DRAFT_934138 [Imleria badia]